MFETCYAAAVSPQKAVGDRECYALLVGRIVAELDRRLAILRRRESLVRFQQPATIADRRARIADALSPCPRLSPETAEVWS